MRPPMRVVFQYDAGPALQSRIAALSEVGLDVQDCAERDDERFGSLMREAHVLWHVLKPVTAAVIDGAPNLRLIQKIGVGVNTIDLESARDRGIKVCNMPGTNSRAVAEMAMALILACLRRLPAFDRELRRRAGWAPTPIVQDDLLELGGRTVGLVGYGSVPRLLTPMLLAMGARVMYWSRTRRADALADWRELADLLAASDIISLHVPLTPETTNLLDARTFPELKVGAILVNTARGGLVDQDALVEALRSGRLRAAGLDVFAQEPIDSANPLLGLDNVVLAPHIAWLTQETLERSLGVAVENCQRLARGEPLLNQVVG